MRRLLLILFFAAFVAGISAQDDVSLENSTLKHSVATNSFWKNWFVQANASYNYFSMDEDHGHHLEKGLFKSFRTNFGASFAFGKWFCPELGLRTKVSGIWGKLPYLNKNINYWNLQEQALLNLSNLFCGYNESRVWNLIPYAGFGTFRNCSANRYSMGYSFGVLNTFRLCRRISLNVDVYATSAENDFDGYHGDLSTTSLKSHDNIFSVELGLTFNIGRSSWERVPDVDAIQALNQGQIDALNAQIADLQSENSQDSIPQDSISTIQDTVEVSKGLVSTPVSVFFSLDESKITSRKDLQNVREIADYAKANDSKIVVTGYADENTGNESYNKKLSQKRADAVADEIVKMGVNRENVEVIAAGGTSVLSPLNYNRRVTVRIK